MVYLIARCAFCGKRYALDNEDAELWFVRCTCGAYGFTEDETEFSDGEYVGAGFGAHAFLDSSGTFVHLSDPLPLSVKESGAWIYVFWYKKDEELPL